MRLRVAWLGKTKDPSIAALTAAYGRRLNSFGRFAAVAVEEFAGKGADERLLRRATGCRLWLLDPGGKSYTSSTFAAFLDREAALYGQETIFALGAADGFTAPLQAAAVGKISLSPLTFSHELARVVLLEQLFRGLAILTNHPYPH